MIILDFWCQLLLGGVLVYLLCNINYAVLISKTFKKKDIRTCGSGNPGTTNMLRSFGFGYGALTFALDALKGVLSVAAALLIFKAVSGEYVVLRFAGYFWGMCAILGHVFPVFLRFKGGKGFATTIGAFIVLNPLWTAVFLAIGLVLLFIWDYMSVFALFFATALLVQNIICFVLDTAIVSSGALAFFIAAVAIDWFVVIFAHRSNIRRLFGGCENKTGTGKLFGKKEK